ncbi:MAG: DivIVA domain-containing protein [Solirubrobacteraceae bacterium]
MPDQSSAAREHAILQEITAPLEHLPDDPVAMVNADFPSALRGYDRLAVDAYIKRTSQLVAELQATRSPEAAVRRALERVGEQISGILQRAHDTAEQITGQSRGEAEDRLEAARVEAAEIIAAAQQRVKDLDADTDRIWIERGRIVDDARDLAAQLMSVAENASDRFPEVESEPHSLGDGSEPDPLAGGSEPDAVDDRGETEDEGLEPRDAEHQSEAELYDAETTVYHADPETTVRYGPADDDVEATRRFAPLTDERAHPPPPEPPAGASPPPEGAAPPPEGGTSPPEGPPAVRGTRSVIPPASQAAADRRASH